MRQSLSSNRKLIGEKCQVKCYIWSKNCCESKWSILIYNIQEGHMYVQYQPPCNEQFKNDFIMQSCQKHLTMRAQQANKRMHPVDDCIHKAGDPSLIEWGRGIYSFKKREDIKDMT